jgi:hypothetical protein
MTLYSQYLLALTAREYARAADLMLLISAPLPQIDLAPVRARLEHAMRYWERQSQSSDASKQSRSLTASSNEIGKVAVEYKFRTNWGMLKLGRTFSTLDMSLVALYPRINYPDMMQKYYKEASRRQLFRRLGALLRAPLVLGDIVSIAEPFLRNKLIGFHQIGQEVDRFVSRLLDAVCVLPILGGIYLFLTFTHQRNLLPAHVDHVAIKLIGNAPVLDMGSGEMLLALLAFFLLGAFGMKHLHLQRRRLVQETYPRSDS